MGRGRHVVSRLLPAAVIFGLLGAFGGGSANASLLPGLPTLTSIIVSPSTASIFQGQTQQFTASGLLSNGTLQAITSGLTWSTSSPSVGSVDPSGVFNGLTAGVETVTATAPTGLLGLLSPLTGTAVVTVLPVLDSIAVSPNVASVAQGQTQQFTATGLMSDLSTQDLTNLVTWTSSSGLASVGSQGLATGGLPGVSTITATAPAGLLASLPGNVLSSSALLTVIPGTTPTPPSPLLSLSPGSGKVRTGVIASGTNFVPGSPVTVRYLSGLKAKKRASTVLCNTTVASNGTFSCGARIPPRSRSGKRGNHTIVATESSSSQAIQAIFDLLKGRG